MSIKHVLKKTWHQIFIVKCMAFGISKYSMLKEVMCAVIKFDVMFEWFESIKFRVLESGIKYVQCQVCRQT